MNDFEKIFGKAGLKFYIGNPNEKGTAKEVDLYEMLKVSGQLDRWKKERGIILNPTHNFKLLKPVRLELFEKAKKDFIHERKVSKLKTTDFELNLFRLA
ncbi:MAG TPA: hypothetical protein VNJ07_11325, partial [Chitinophagales bacterium]|nr:hypothetical protein [Chitinophagales bacterium]